MVSLNVLVECLKKVIVGIGGEGSQPSYLQPRYSGLLRATQGQSRELEVAGLATLASCTDDDPGAPETSLHRPALCCNVLRCEALSLAATQRRMLYSHGQTSLRSSRTSISVASALSSA